MLCKKMKQHIKKSLTLYYGFTPIPRLWWVWIKISLGVCTEQSISFGYTVFYLMNDAVQEALTYSEICLWFCICECAVL